MGDLQDGRPVFRGLLILPLRPGLADQRSPERSRVCAARDCLFVCVVPQSTVQRRPTAEPVAIRRGASDRLAALQRQFGAHNQRPKEETATAHARDDARGRSNRSR